MTRQKYKQLIAKAAQNMMSGKDEGGLTDEQRAGMEEHRRVCFTHSRQAGWRRLEEALGL